MKSIIICLFLFAITSCTKKEEIIISDVSKSEEFKYKVIKNKTYTNYIVNIKGTVDDTIVIQGFHKLKGEIDTTFTFDYYGGDDYILLNYNSYKAKKGHLKIINYAN